MPRMVGFWFGLHYPAVLAGMLIPLHQVAPQKRRIPPVGSNWPRRGINYAVNGRREAPPESEG